MNYRVYQSMCKKNDVYYGDPELGNFYVNLNVIKVVLMCFKNGDFSVAKMYFKRVLLETGMRTVQYTYRAQGTLFQSF
jgi:hypothetical protein